MTKNILLTGLMGLMSLLLFTSCSSYDDTYDFANGIPNAAARMVYDGKWDVDGAAGTKTLAVDYGKSFGIAELPYAEVLRILFPGDDVDIIGVDYENGNVPYSMTVMPDKSILYSLQPNAWGIVANINGVEHRLKISFSNINSTEKTQWGTLSKNGLLSLVMRVTSYSVDGGSEQQTSIKITFTATRKQNSK